MGSMRSIATPMLSLLSAPISQPIRLSSVRRAEAGMPSAIGMGEGRMVPLPSPGIGGRFLIEPSKVLQAPAPCRRLEH